VSGAAGKEFVYFRGVAYTGSYPDVASCPEDGLPVIAFTGRSNSGKSSLLSALCDHKNLAHTSKSAGKTKTLNYFYVPEEKPFYLLDMPGYGFARMAPQEKGKLRRMIDRFLLESDALRFTILVLDARRTLASEERGIVEFCRMNDRPFLLARSKWDLLNQKEKAAAKRVWKEEGVLEHSLPVSSLKKIGLTELIGMIRKATERKR